MLLLDSRSLNLYLMFSVLKLEGALVPSVRKGEVFCVVNTTTTPGWVEVFSPYPGEGPAIIEAEYSERPIVCGDTPFLFPPDVDDGDIELFRLQKGGVSAFVEQEAVETGDHLFIRGRRHEVVTVVSGGQLSDFMGGKDMVTLSPAISFNAREITACRCKPMTIMCKAGHVKCALQDFEKIDLKYSVPRSSHNSFGSLHVQFSSFSFNSFGVCHQDSFYHLPVQ